MIDVKKVREEISKMDKAAKFFERQANSQETKIYRLLEKLHREDDRVNERIDQLEDKKDKKSIELCKKLERYSNRLNALIATPKRRPT